ncbi:hypothetical protein AwDysgo_09700 [Bacteroidales bacterium]|nr:hypothetical protein AwDysgo_09700 [Bacteroidales bacterium]
MQTAGVASIALVASASLSGCSNQAATLQGGEILHTVMFNLRWELDSAQSKKFIDDAKAILPSIGTVQDFQVFRQVSPKNDFIFGFYMKFASKKDYDTYNEHPDHLAFVNDRWIPEVAQFQEADFINE